MDIVLGVSLTPTTVRMVLVEGAKADGATVDHDVFPVSPSNDSATPSAADQVVAAVLGTQESAQAGGHHLAHIGVTWTDHTEAATLRDALAAHGIADVMLVSELHAASALAQAAGAAVGYHSTALLFLDRDTATLSVVNGDDGSVVKVLSRSLHSTDAMAVLADMAAAVAGQESAPHGMFVVGSGVDVSSVKEHLEHLVDIPVSAPEESELALARGAALAAANAPTFEASTVGLAYSQDPDGPTAGSAFALASADTQLAVSSAAAPLFTGDVDAAFAEAPAPVEEDRKPFLLVGSALTSIFVVGVVALAVSLAVSIRPTADQRPSPAQNAVAPSAQPAAPAPVPEAAPVQPAAPPPPAETIKAPIPVVQEAPQPRKVYVEQAPAPAAPAPEPAAPPPAPAPAAPVPDPVPVYVPPPAPAPVFQWPHPVFRAPWDPPKQQYPDNDYPDQYPGGANGGYPGQYPGGSNGGYPGQYPGSSNGGYPGSGNPGGNGGYPGQYPGSSNGGYPGSGNQGGYGNGNGNGNGRGDRGDDGPKKSGPCFLIFCAPR
ncbi:hypothetical protein HZU40_07660 [Mycolicibacterium fluoranthenivorans]|uniref:DUF7159 domain-containing protein n=1 Tax=Mycolicibacterium fluoranthenivorans TaxID=258505 RepID=A0A7G8PII0_9MYCO|nr:hypothetical protein [Mycolicibacterium fluoranthenivorans]QNJ94146.1 hypothetical protein HZU40_07660 [Mycolicibacterium fluoranthenivorans]